MQVCTSLCMCIDMHACVLVCMPLLVLMSVSPAVCVLDAAALCACARVGVSLCTQRLLSTHTHTNGRGRQVHPARLTLLHQVFSRFLALSSLHEPVGAGEGIRLFEAQQHLRERARSLCRAPFPSLSATCLCCSSLPRVLWFPSFPTRSCLRTVHRCPVGLHMRART